MNVLHTTEYFREVVLRKRPYLTLEFVQRVVLLPQAREIQPGGRIRLWARLPELGGRALRVVLLEDGATVLNAFLDRDAPLPEE